MHTSNSIKNYELELFQYCSNIKMRVDSNLYDYKTKARFPIKLTNNKQDFIQIQYSLLFLYKEAYQIKIRFLRSTRQII